MKHMFFFMLILTILGCNKSIMRQQGFYEIENFEWDVNEDLNKLNIRLFVADSPVDTITVALVKIKVDELELENRFDDLTVKLNYDEKSLRKGEKCIAHSWIPSIDINQNNLEDVRLYVRGSK